MTLRGTYNQESFVHVHPGRYSPNTFRVKANTIKTAILARALALHYKRTDYDIDLINEARIKLSLSPVNEKVSSIYATIEKLED